jgi:hypothetical protein
MNEPSRTAALGAEFRFLQEKTIPRSRAKAVFHFHQAKENTREVRYL